MSRMKKTDVLIISCIILVGVIILVFRISRNKGTEADTYRFDPEAFYDYVVNPYPMINNGYITLIVFMDPDKDCPVCLSESFEWIKPMEKYPDYNVVLFISQSVSKKAVSLFTMQLGIDKDKVIYYDPTMEISGYHKYGVFKVLYSSEKGVLWYERGSQSPQEYRRFSDRLESSISSSL